MDIKIIHEDDSLIVIDKPPGITVNKAETTIGQETVQDWVLQRVFANPPQREKQSPQEIASSPATAVGAPRNDNQAEFEEKNGIVHRLDKDTSGVLVIAKTLESYSKLKLQFQNRETVKKYLALVHGVVDPAAGTINVPIDRSPFDRMKFGVFVGGREAETKYKTLKNYKLFTFLEVTPKTGRTHQIRVHMKYINHPIVSDPIYGGRKQLKMDLMFCPRLFLHATSLNFKHPVTNEVLEFKSELPENLEQVLTSLT